LKAPERETVPWVRIPPSPPSEVDRADQIGMVQQ
jgi:hypothetical protein